jgi:hypothetical protein
MAYKPQAQGSLAKVILANEITPKTLPQQVVHDCEAAWAQLVGSDVTATLDATDFKVGSGACKLAVADGASAGEILACGAIAASPDISPFTHVGLWVKSSVTLAAGDLQLLLDDTSGCVSPLETINIPALVKDTWTFIHLVLANPSTDKALLSVGVKMVVDKGAFDLRLDDIRAINPAVVLPIVSETLVQTQELLASQCITQDRNYPTPALGNKAVDGGITTELDAYMVRLFKHMLGSMSMSGIAAPYTYTALVGPLPAGLTVEKGFTDVAEYFAESGCRVGSFKLSGSAGKLAPLDLTLVGTHEGLAVASFDPAAVYYPHVPFSIYTATIKEGSGGTVLATVTDWEINVNNEPDNSSYAIDGTGERYNVPVGRCEVKGQLTCLFTDTMLYSKALLGTATKLEIDLVHGDGEGATAGNEKVTITLEELQFQPKSPAIPGPKGIKIDLPFTAFYQTGASASTLKIEALLPVNSVLY